MDRKRFRSAQIPGIAARAILLVCAAGLLAAAAAARKDRMVSVYERQLRKKTGALDSIKTEITKRRKKIGELEKAEGNYLARLECLESNIAASRQYLAMLSRRIDTAETTIVRLTDSLIQARALLADRQAVMKKRLRGAYMTGTLSPLMTLLMSRDPLDIIHRARYLEEVHAYDRNLAAQIERSRQAIDEKKRSFESKRAELGLLLREKKKENDLLLKEETSRRNIIADIRSKKKSNMAMIAELKSVQKELNAIIRLLEDKRRKAKERSRTASGARSVFERLKGTLPWPLKGPVISRYGKIVHPVYHTVTMNNGIDIGAEPGQQARCVAGGTVMYTGAMRGLGRLVIVEHGGNYLTIYSHLDQIVVSENQKVGTGTVLGRVGAAAEPGNTILHFEIRKSVNSLDPKHWLRR